MPYALSARSLKNLEGVHPDLVDVVKLAIKLTPVDFMVIEGLRTMKRQRELVARGASQTLNSRHLDGHAVDLAAWVDGTVRWDWPLYHKIAPAVKEAAREIGVPIEWGGDWTTFKDGPHWQLPFNSYPKGSNHKTTAKARPKLRGPKEDDRLSAAEIEAIATTGLKPDAPAGATEKPSRGSMQKHEFSVRVRVIEEEIKALKALVERME